MCTYIYVYTCAYIYTHAHIYTCVYIYLDCFLFTLILIFTLTNVESRMVPFYKWEKPCAITIIFGISVLLPVPTCYVLFKDHIYFLGQSLSALIPCTLWAGLFFAVETVLCTVGFLSTSLVYSLDATCILPVITTQSASRHGQTSLCVVCVCVLSVRGCLEITTLSRTAALTYLASTYP